MRVFEFINQVYVFAFAGQYFFGVNCFCYFCTYNLGRGTSSFCMGFMLLGLLMVIFPILMANPEWFSKQLDWSNISAMLILFIFTIVGISLIYFPYRKRKYLEKICTHTVKATIVAHDKDYSNSERLGRSPVYKPIYAFTYNGVKYKVFNDYHSNIGVKKLGEMVEIKINPLNPKVALIEDKATTFMLNLTGIIFILFSLSTLIYFILNESIFIG